MVDKQWHGLYFLEGACFHCRENKRNTFVENKKVAIPLVGSEF